eukprot:scaffold1342_cov204-Pinguiococcus_pyrenoidosus.AAC.13
MQLASTNRAVDCLNSPMVSLDAFTPKSRRRRASSTLRLRRSPSIFRRKGACSQGPCLSLATASAP